jgi:hypothetical protein
LSTELLSTYIRSYYEVYEWKHATAILKYDFPEEWNDLIDILENFRLDKRDIIAPGGRKSPVSSKIDQFLYNRGWIEKKFDTSIVVDGEKYDSPTHKIDCFKNNIAIEIEWNNKDPFYDRDLNNFRLLFDLRVVSVGVIITRSDELQEIFKMLNKGKSYGASTTHIGKLIPRIEGGSGGGCPILVFGITKKLYTEDM